ncbi:uncharacterized protein LOC118648006 isoform X2 [Monomorium pharaonis]|nr:uncharacterized protein LOC105833854 [Monomorium pharaonis]XP_036146953.1 uncharacterized protein LOC118647004 isoform X2 [Monomorium pharaonis]XP_036147009.1 uncharacterized protein LOC118647024 isoform X2 [Monomorium pharaonis]XP_036150098.1 uncharacterized protein LOC118648006 isoform X2 [Monomorium pharaonis]
MGVDRRGNHRGKCTACDCDEFELPQADDNTNVCSFCGHYSPLHERVEIIKEAHTHEITMPTIVAIENLTDSVRNEVIEVMEVINPNEDPDSQQTLQSANNVEQQDNDIIVAEENNWLDNNKTQLLPSFSSYVMPFLEGQAMSPKKKKKLCSQLKDEIIDHLDRHNLIPHNINHMKKRWQYRDLGEALVTNFPSIHIEQSPKFKTKCGHFVHQIADIRRHRNNRRECMQQMHNPLQLQKKTNKKGKLIQVITPEEAYKKLQDSAEDELSTTTIVELLQQSFQVRPHVGNVWPYYLSRKECFVQEAELRMKTSIESVINTINTMYKKTAEKGINNILQLQKFVTLRGTKDFFLEQKVPTFDDLLLPSPGPKVFYNDATAWLVISEIDQLKIDVTSAEEAAALGFAIYFMKDLTYPSSFSQLLGLIDALCLGNNNEFLCKRAKEILSHCTL